LPFQKPSKSTSDTHAACLAAAELPVNGRFSLLKAENREKSAFSVPFYPKKAFGFRGLREKSRADGTGR